MHYPNDMLISRETLPGHRPNLIRAYAPGQVTVNETVIRRSFIITPDELMLNWAPASFAALGTEHLDDLLAKEPEIILLGTGSGLQHPGIEMMSHVLRHGIGFEIMDTPSVCRTYNILMSESRHVVAGILFD